MTALVERLRTCPHCGSEQVTTSPCETITDDIRPEVTWAAICKACGARVDRDTEAEAIAAWNTRASDPLIEQLVEALDQCRAIIKFHVRDSGVCCTLAGSDKPFSALDAFKNAVTALSAARGETENG